MTLSKEEFAAKHAQSKVTTDQLDEMFEAVVNRKTTFRWVINLATLICFFLYLYCRKRLLEESWLVAKQKYYQDNVKDNRSQVDGDLV